MKASGPTTSPFLQNYFKAVYVTPMMGWLQLFLLKMYSIEAESISPELIADVIARFPDADVSLLRLFLSHRSCGR